MVKELIENSVKTKGFNPDEIAQFAKADLDRIFVLIRVRPPVTEYGPVHLRTALNVAYPQKIFQNLNISDNCLKNTFFLNHEISLSNKTFVGKEILLLTIVRIHQPFLRKFLVLFSRLFNIYQHLNVLLSICYTI